MNMQADRQLKWLLRVVGAMEVLAFPFIFLPFSGMAAIHSQILGLGTMPEGPIVEYLARTLSALYAAHGSMVLFLATDVPRFRPIIILLSWLHLVFGVLLIGIDQVAGLPVWLVLGEGPSIVLLGGVMLWLVRKGGSQQAP